MQTPFKKLIYAAYENCTLYAIAQCFLHPPFCQAWVAPSEYPATLQMEMQPQWKRCMCKYNAQPVWKGVVVLKGAPPLQINFKRLTKKLS